MIYDDVGVNLKYIGPKALIIYVSEENPNKHEEFVTDFV